MKIKGWQFALILSFLALVTLFSTQLGTGATISVSGTVYDYRSPYLPLEGVQVCIYREDSGEPYACTTTDQDGAYFFTELSIYLRYVVESIPSEPSTFAKNYYPDQFFRENATVINFDNWSYSYPPPPTYISTWTDIDFHLVPGGSISGQLNLPDLLVCLEATDGSPIECVTSDSDGNYMILGLVSGDYLLRVERPAGFTEQYYPGVFDVAGAGLVTVFAPLETAEINFELPPVGSITGVIDLEGGPIVLINPYPSYDQNISTGTLAGTKVCAAPFSEPGLTRCAITDNSGFFRIDYLSEGEYRVWAEDVLGHAGQYYPGVSELEDAQPVSVMPPETTYDISMILPMDSFGDPGSVSGTVYDFIHPDQPLAGVYVCADYGVLFGCSTTGPDGRYWIGYNTTTNRVNYLIKVIPSTPGTYAQNFFPDQFLRENAQWVTISPTTPGRTDVDFHLVVGGSISGNVNFPNLQVCAEQLDGRTAACDRTDEDGNYLIPGLISQEYFVRVERPDNTAVQYYPNASSRATAIPVELIAPEAVDQINFNLPESGFLTGRILYEVSYYNYIPYPNPNPTPVYVSTQVCVYDSITSEQRGCRNVYGPNSYTFEYLTVGDYFVYAQPASTYFPQYYPSGTLETDAVPVRVSANANTNADFILPRLDGSVNSGSISGLVTGAAPDMRACALYIYPQATICDRVDADGSYKINYLPEGNYKVSVRYLDNFDVRYYPNAVYRDNAETVVVTLGEETPGININLEEETQETFTPAGEDTTISLTENLSLVFDEVLSSGYTQVITEIPDPELIPPNFQILGDLVNITTDAFFTSAQVCISYDDSGLSPEDEALLGIYHWDFDETVGDFIWKNVTDPGYPDLANNRVCGTVTSFSPFMIARETHHEVVEINAPLEPNPIETQVDAFAVVENMSPSETYQAIWDWGDGVTSPGVFGDAQVTGQHVYSEAGIYTVQLMITDSLDRASSLSFQYVVIFDPEGGFVTGGGWILSPPGAYTLNPDLVGKATFGFVSKYQKGTTIPTGNTEFQFQAGNLSFRSTSYQWLVISGSMAKFKGQGTINGAGEYGFMLSAIDGELASDGETDRFRIKIWDLASGSVIYDNQLGDLDDALPSTMIGGGSIIIHKK